MAEDHGRQEPGLPGVHRAGPPMFLAPRQRFPRSLEMEERRDAVYLRHHAQSAGVIHLGQSQNVVCLRQRALPISPFVRLLQILPRLSLPQLCKRRFPRRRLDPPAGVRRLPRLPPETPYEVREFLLGEERLHEPNQLAHHRGVVPFAPQFVIDGVEALGCQVAPLLSYRFHLHGPPVGQSAEQRRSVPDIETRPVRDLLTGRGLPQIDRGQVHPALHLGDAFEVTAEVLGVLVDQGYQLLHQIPQRTPAPEPGHDHQEPRISPGQNLQRPHPSFSYRMPAHPFPQPPAVLRVQSLQFDDPEQFEERRRSVVEAPKTGSGRRDQGDLRFGLQCFPKAPSEVVPDIRTQCLEVFHHEDQPPIQPVGRVEDGRSGVEFQVLASPAFGQERMRCAQFLAEGRVGRPTLSRQMEQCLAPEVRQVEDLVILLAEPRRQQATGELGVRPEFAGQSRQQHGLAHTAPADDDEVLAGLGAEVLPQDIQQELEFVIPYDELGREVLVLLQNAGIEFPDGCHGGPGQRASDREFSGSWCSRN